MSAQHIQADVDARVYLFLSVYLCRIRNVFFCSYFDKSVGNAAGPAAAQVSDCWRAGSVGGGAGGANTFGYDLSAMQPAATHTNTHRDTIAYTVEAGHKLSVYLDSAKSRRGRARGGCSGVRISVIVRFYACQTGSQ